MMIGSMMFNNSIQAQEDKNDLDPVTITASMAPEKISRTGRNIFVIRGERFNNLPVHSIDELLRYLPGIEMQSRGPMGSQSDIVLRGGTFQQVLVIMDGLRLNDPNTGHFSGYIPIAPSEIERIEILKGASSAIYGSEAVGGVIHIITRSFAAKMNDAGSQISSKLTAGEYKLVSGNAGVFFSNGKTSLGAGILSNNTSGQPQRGIHGFVYANTVSFSLGHHFNEQWELNMRYAYDARNFAAQNFYTTFISDTAREKINSFWNQLGIVRNGKNDRLQFSLGYKTLEDEFQFNSVGVPNKSISTMVQALLTDEWRLKPNTTITSGLQYVSKRIASNDRGRHRVDQAAAFVTVNQQWGEKFFASPALRAEWNERSGWEIIPQVNLSYRVHQLQLRASAGKTIRDADFTERYNNYNKTFVASGRIGDPGLSAEQSISYEAGADYFLNRELKLSATFFQRYHSKLIDYVPTPYSQMPRQVNLSPTGSYALAKNISSVNTTGLEADLQWVKKWTDHKEVWASLGLVWLQSRSSEATPSFYISSHAKFLTNFNLVYRLRKWSMALNGIYKNREPQVATVNIAKVSGDYFVLNARIDHMLLRNQLSVFIQADNLFDTRYADLLGAQMPGRWLMGGIKISLSK